MKFAAYLKEQIQIHPLDEVDLDPNEFCCQYNPDRFHLYRSTCSGKPKNVLKLGNSPHCHFLRLYQASKPDWKIMRKTPYHKMQRLYGRKDKWIKGKMDSFIFLFEAVRREEPVDRLVVLNKPIVKNKFNSKYEIYEGHHRASCYLVLGKEAPSILSRVSYANNG